MASGEYSCDHGNIHLGGAGTQGDLILKSQTGGATLRLDGGDGNVFVGATEPTAIC